MICYAHVMVVFVCFVNERIVGVIVVHRLDEGQIKQAMDGTLKPSPELFRNMMAGIRNMPVRN